MANSGAVQVKLELGHRAQVRKKPTVEGFTHDWIVFVRGPEQSNIQHFVEKVVFHLHESFPKPKRVFKDPPYKVEESGYAGFILPIEVYFRNKEEPKKVRFDYDLFLHLEGHPPVNHLRCEKLTFNNPTEEFRKKLLKAGGQRDPHKRSSEDSKVMVMQEGATSLFGQHMKLPTLPASTLASGLSDAKKSKNFHGSKDGPKGSSTALLTASTTSTTSNNTPANHNNNNTTTNNNNSSSSFFKLHKASMEHKERPAKDLKEPKSALHRDSGWAPGHAPKEPSRKPKENQPLRDINPKIGFKEPKSLSSKERRSEGPCLGKRPPPPPPPPGPHNGEDHRHHVTKKRKDLAGKQGFASDGQQHAADKRPPKDRARAGKPRADPPGDKGDPRRVDPGDKGDPRRAYSLPSFKGPVEPVDSDAEDAVKSDSEQPSPASSSSSSGFSHTRHKPQVVDLIVRKRVALPGANHTVLGSMQPSVIPDLQSESEDESEDGEGDRDGDSDFELHAQAHNTHVQTLTHTPHLQRRSVHRVSLSDGSESENSSSPLPASHGEAPPFMKNANSQILEVTSPSRHSKQDKSKSLDCDKTYLDELVDLHRRLMTLREGHILQQIVNLIEETGHFHITNTTFDFDLCSLDRSTVRKLQSYLDVSGLS
ncbi:protein AF-9 isoform X1 [Gadus morhua]|uniref:MLLT3 super elongation complex subunit n=1 Tax=Gadus morhua TaxID=8049 RepID=A0A8C5FP45_GADMO|nr:protein AF-9 isoform X1 [Gadus morhua]